MLFYRSSGSPREVSLPAVRTLSTVSLLAYPAGALTLTLASESPAASAAGYGLVLLSIAAYLLLIGSWVHRIVGEDAKMLDERELRLRGRALSRSYVVFTSVVLLSLLYAGLATDLGGWVPRSFEEFNGIFFGVVLSAAVLPIAVLSWIVQPAPAGN
jgi:hypothetical protein